MSLSAIMSACATRQTRVSCFCPTGGTTFQITVSAGAISRVINPQIGSDVVASQYTMFRTVDQLFEEVRKAGNFAMLSSSLHNGGA